MRRCLASELESLKCCRVGFSNRPLGGFASETYLATLLAHVGLFSGVNTLVDGQGRALDEHLATVGIVAGMRPMTSVDALCLTSQYAASEQTTRVD